MDSALNQREIGFLEIFLIALLMFYKLFNFLSAFP